MRRLVMTSGLAAGLLILGGCSTYGQPSDISLAERITRCERLGGTLAPTGAQTERDHADFRCVGTAGRILVARGSARTDLNRAVDYAVRNGPVGGY